MSETPACPRALPQRRLQLLLVVVAAAVLVIGSWFGAGYLARATDTGGFKVYHEAKRMPPSTEAEARAPGDDIDRIRAPDFDGGVEWLNCGGPIRLKDLRGKVVLLDFWTYCCINCMHILPDLAKLEKKYPNELVVIGVHSAKFDAEKDSKNIREAILRYHIEHPVVNDANHKIWDAYVVRSWPTFTLIDPEGYVYGQGSGEGLGEVLDSAIAKLVQTHRAKKTLSEKPVSFIGERFKLRLQAPLFFPGKVLADTAKNRLFIADSSHHRIVITDLAGKQIAVAGAGHDGKDDGPFAKATFNDPQGLAIRGDTLYVADRKNHLIRALDLGARTVTTIAGTGEQGRERRADGEARSIGLNSPWDLWLLDDMLYIAMAGHHQLWKLDLKTNRIASFAGSGREDIRDGTKAWSAFAQPSGLTSDGDWLYVADSEVSAVRAVSLKGDGAVKTLVGEGLFEFGDNDGVGDLARLQHCLGVAYYRGKVYVADTYNNKIKVIDVTTRDCRTFLGDGQLGAEDQPPRFNEPGGVSIAGDKLYVADTNNHAIRVVDLKTKQVKTLQLTGVAPPAPPQVAARPSFANAVMTKQAEFALPKDGELVLQVKFDLPVGFKLSPLAPVQFAIETPGGEEIGKIDDPKSPLTLKVAINKLGPAKTLKVSLAYMMCQEGGEGVCKLRSHVWEIPLRRDAAGTERIVSLVTKGEEK